MIKCTNIVEEISTNPTIVRCYLIADTTAEVTAAGTSGKDIDGLGEYITMGFGSICLVATGEVGMLNSNGEWKF